MRFNFKKALVGGIVAVGVTVPTSLFINQRNINQNINEQLNAEKEAYKVQIQEHEREAKKLTEELDSKSEVIESLQQQVNQLEAENQSLEGVRSTIIDNVGYYPSDYERELLERLVECEAGAESITGKIAVVNVVLNRIKSEEFPDSITDVIYQKNQFEPIVTGIIYQKTPSEESKEAVKRAFLGERVVDSDIVNFWASWLDSDNEIWNHIEIVTTIGVHHFGRGWN